MAKTRVYPPFMHELEMPHVNHIAISKPSQNKHQNPVTQEITYCKESIMLPCSIKNSRSCDITKKPPNQ